MTKINKTLIVLNGASSSGKTTIAKELVSLLGDECVSTGLDDILERVQPFGSETSGFVNRLLRNLRIIYFNATDGRFQLFKRLHREVVSHYQSNRSVIVATAWMDPRALLDAAEQFAPLNGFLVGVKPPLSVSVQWEAQRGDREIGQAQKHYDLIHVHGVYDLVIDPSQMPPRDCALYILSQQKEVQPHAFRQILGRDH